MILCGKREDSCEWKAYLQIFRNPKLGNVYPDGIKKGEKKILKKNDGPGNGLFYCENLFLSRHGNRAVVL